MEGSPSGLWRRLGKAVYWQRYRGFESLSLRHVFNLLTICIVDTGMIVVCS